MGVVDGAVDEVVNGVVDVVVNGVVYEVVVGVVNAAVKGVVDKVLDYVRLWFKLELIDKLSKSILNIYGRNKNNLLVLISINVNDTNIFLKKNNYNLR